MKRKKFADTKAYEEEWKDTIEILQEQNAHYPSFAWFLELGKRISEPEQLRHLSPRVILIGHCFPDEIIRGLGVAPYYLQGGSFYEANLGEPQVPRDTDSAIKTIFGMLTDPDLKLTEKAIILLPVSGDSMRKIYDVFSKDMKIVPIEVPYDWNDPLQKARWHDEILRVTFEVEKHLLRHLTGRALRKQCELSAAAAAAWKEFYALHQAAPGAVNGSAALWIANSYHWYADKAEWTAQLIRLTNEIRRARKPLLPEQHRPNVMIVGSPVYAPNYKIPLLVEEMGMEYHSLIHPDPAHICSDVPTTGRREQLLLALADQYLHADMSPAFVENELLTESVLHDVQAGRVQGIILHILKGQIEYDFELNRLEKLIEPYEIPIFRLETDYNYQDVEQLRVRMEAFAEMLHHREKIQGAKAC